MCIPNGAHFKVNVMIFPNTVKKLLIVSLLVVTAIVPVKASASKYGCCFSCIGTIVLSGMLIGTGTLNYFQRKADGYEPDIL